MPSTREIRQRIKSVNNIAKVTNAMQLIAASKMRRAQQQVLASRQFSAALLEITNRVAASAPENVRSVFPLLADREVKKSLVVLITPNRGLAGALVGNIIKVAMNELDERADKQVEAVALGRKGERFVVRSQWELQASFELGEAPKAEEVQSTAEYLINQFQTGAVDEVVLVYARFINTVNQKAESLRVLPIKLDEVAGDAENSTEQTPIAEDAPKAKDFIYEPNVYELVGTLLPRYVTTQIYQAVLESAASEHSARMVAMRNATDNANQINSDLTLEYNKARQEYITAELLDIVGGAGALEN